MLLIEILLDFICIIISYFQNDGETSGGLSGSEVQDSASISQDGDKNDDKDKSKKKNRCFVCRKKVGLTGMNFIFKSQSVFQNS